MGLLSGLSNLGLEKLENADIYQDDTESKQPQQTKATVATEVKEEDILFDKKCECPACGSEVIFRAVRSGKLKLIGNDPDLRPKYDKFDPAKYDVIVCAKCGYAALSKYFQPLPAPYVKLLRENICGKVHGIPNNKVLSYDDAIQRYQLALASAIVRKAKDSEKAYICLKLAWIIRGKKESLSEDMMGYEDIVSVLRKDENEALKSAFEGFIAARSKENFPMCGMDEPTLDYLLAVLAARFGHFEIAQKLIGGILVSKTANNRIKDRTRELKEQVKMDMQLASNS